MSRRRFMTNVGDIRLPSEYQRVEYLESTGTQYITTNHQRKKGIKIEATFSNIIHRQDSCLVGCGDANNGFRFFIACQLENLIQFTIGTTQTNALNIIENDNLKRTFFIDSYKNEYGDDNNIYTAIDSDIITGDYISLFIRNNYPHATVGIGKVYEAIIYENTIMICSLIPCYRKSDNKPGMYDVVNNIFYTNQGTGEFILGPNV